MDDIEKALNNLDDKDKKKLKDILKSLKSWPWKGLSVKKLKGTDKIFRVKKGDLRVVFRLEDKGKVFLLKIDKISEDTYRDF